MSAMNMSFSDVCVFLSKHVFTVRLSLSQGFDMTTLKFSRAFMRWQKVGTRVLPFMTLFLSPVALKHHVFWVITQGLIRQVCMVAHPVSPAFSTFVQLLMP